MAVTIKTKEEIEILREGGKRLAFILEEVGKATKAGVSTLELDNLAQKLVEEGGDKAAFLNFKPAGAKRAYPATICISINDEIVHGIPNENSKIIKDGDIVSLDMGLNHKGLFTDSAITVGVGEVDEAGKNLIEDTKRALFEGINAIKENKHVRDISLSLIHI